jgi:hypothetical protein
MCVIAGALVTADAQPGATPRPSADGHPGARV